MKRCLVSPLLALARSAPAEAGVRTSTQVGGSPR
jgi:hypothetical protein